MKKIFQVLLAVIFILPIMLVSGCKSKLIDLKVLNLPTTVIVGEDLDTTNVAIELIHKKDKDNQTINDQEKFSLSKIDTSVIGEQTLKITYEDFEKEIKINVIGVQNITLQNETTKILKGETVSFDNLSALITFDDGTTRQVSKNDLSITDMNTNTSGDIDYKVTYKNMTISKTINVVEITNIEIQDFSQILYGEEINITNKQIKVTFDDLSTEMVTSNDVTLSQIDTLAEGETNYVITYKGKSVNQKINVIGIKEMVVSNLETKYLKGEEPDFSRVTAKITYKDTLNTQKDLTINDLTIEGFDKDETSSQLLFIKYKNYEVTQIVKVVEIKDITIQGLEKVMIEEDIDLSNRTITLTYSDNSTKTLTLSEIQVSTIDTMSTGLKNYTITYRNNQIGKTIIVLDVKSVVIDNFETVKINQNINLTGNALVTYTDNSTETVSVNDILISDIDTTIAKEVEYTVTYKNRQVTNTILVIEIKSIEVQNFEKLEKLETYTFENATIVATYSDNETTEVLDNALVTIEGLDTTTSGEKTLTLTYNQKQFTQNYVVYEISGLSVIGTIPSLKFESDGVVDYTQVENIVVSYTHNQPNKTITLEDLTSYELVVDTTTSGEKALNLTYKYYTETMITVMVTEKPTVTSFVIDYPRNVKVNDNSFSLNSVTATVTYSEQDLPEETVYVIDYTTDVVDVTLSGTYTINVKFEKDGVETYNTSFVINVVAITNIELDTLEYETEVRVGEAYDTSKITKATVTYGDNIFTEEVGVNDLVIDTITTQEKGIKELKVSYNGYTQNISIIVHGVRDITLNDEIKAVIINQELNLDNITLANVTYEDDYVEENVAIADLQIGNIDTTTSGVKQLTISYKGFSKVFDVLVKDYKELNVTGDLPVNVRKNDTIDLSNLVIIVVFDDESTMEITLNDVLVIGNDTTNVGQKTLVISYLDLDYSHNYNVVGVTKIELMESEYETQVRIGQEYDITKITQATVTYGDGVFVDTVLREDLSIDNITTTEKGIKQLKIAYNGYVESLDITVHGVKDITLNGDIQSVLVNETLNLDNITLANITYEDDYVEENVAIADLQIGTIDTTTSGTKLLTISYKGFDKNFEVEVIGYQSLTVEGTLPTEVLLYQDFDLSGITKFILTYTNSTTKELSIDDVEITGIDTETNGEKTLTIKYGTVQYTHNYTVIGIIVAGFDAPKSLTDYNTNKTNTTGDASFTIANRDYVVGTENAYVLNPIIDAYDENGDPVAINEVATNITFEVSSDNEHFTAVTDTSLYLDRIGETNVDIDFNEDAVGKYFKITVNAVENEEEKFTHTFKVVKGYNIYTAKQLAVVDNSQSEWDDIKAEMGLQNVTTNTIILHDRIVITKDDIPAANFWTAEELTEKGLDQSIVGSFKEEQNSDYVMVREIAENSAFTVYGNYFDIDASQIPLCKWNSGDGYTSAGAITMHASLFNFRNSTNALNAKVYMQEISFLGNTQRTDDPLMSGGLLLFKTNNITMDIDNTAFQKWYTAYMFEDTINYITIDGVNYTLRDYCNEYYTFVKDSVTYYLSKENDKPTNKVYDSSALANQVFTENTISVTRNFNEINHTKGFECYNTHFYMWGAQVNIRNSVMKSAGGPVLIADHVNSSHFGSSEADIKAGINGRPSYVYIYDSQLESYISGLEPWFETYGATALVTQMKQLDVYFNADATRLAAGSSEMNSVYAYVVQQIMEAYSCDLDTAIATLEQISASYSMTMNSTFLKEIEGVPLMNLVSVSKSGSAEGLTTYRTRNIIEFVDNGVSQAGLKTGGSYADTVTGYGQMVIIENTRNGQYFDPVAGYMGYTTDSANNGMVNSAFSSCYTTGNTYLNFYIFNGMGVSMQLFPKN